MRVAHVRAREITMSPNPPDPSMQMHAGAVKAFAKLGSGASVRLRHTEFGEQRSAQRVGFLVPCTARMRQATHVSKPICTSLCSPDRPKAVILALNPGGIVP